MPEVPLHPSIVHVPLGVALVLPLVALVLVVAAWRGALPWRTWAVVVGLQVLVVGAGVLGLRTGEEEEERVEQVVPEAPLETHEERGKAFVVASGVGLVLGLLTLALRRDGARRGLAVATVAGLVVAAALGVRAGRSGGELVYRHGAASVDDARTSGRTR